MTKKTKNQLDDIFHIESIPCWNRRQEFCRITENRHFVVKKFVKGIFSISKEKQISIFFVLASFIHKTKCKCTFQTIGSTVLKRLGAHNDLAEPENA